MSNNTDLKYAQFVSEALNGIAAAARKHSICPQSGIGSLVRILKEMRVAGFIKPIEDYSEEEKLQSPFVAGKFMFVATREEDIAEYDGLVLTDEEVAALLASMAGKPRGNA